MFFNSWENILNTVFIGILAFIVIVLLLRISGKRTLSKWNAFDLIVTVALGSSLATSLLSKETTLAQGVAGFSILILIQFLVTFLSVRSVRFQRIIKATPTLLVKQGNYLKKEMMRERVSESEILAALRNRGIASLSKVAAVVLETDGTFSIITEWHQGPDSTLNGVNMKG